MKRIEQLVQSQIESGRGLHSLVLDMIHICSILAASIEEFFNVIAS